MLVLQIRNVHACHSYNPDHMCINFLGNAGLESENVTESSENWRKCQAIGQILSSCPLQADSVEKYYSLVCPQV